MDRLAKEYDNAIYLIGDQNQGSRDHHITLPAYPAYLESWIGWQRHTFATLSPYFEHIC
jgi:hypothetical protein